MTTHATWSGSGMHREAESTRGTGMMIFAAVILGVLGLFNLLDGIAAIASAHVFVGSAVYVVGNLNAWGWVMAVLGAIQILAAIGVSMGNQAARWLGVAVVAANTLAQMFFISSYPLWSVMIIAVDIVAMCALCMYGGKENAIV